MKTALITIALLATAISANSREHIKLDMGKEFSGIKTSAPVDIYLCNKADSAGFVTYDIDPSINDILKIEVIDKTLTFSLENNNREVMNDFFKKVSTVKVYLPEPLENITLSGAGDIDAASSLSLANNVNIKISGAGDIEMEKIKTGTLSLSVTGVGDIEIDGLATESADINVSGAGDVKIKRFTAQSADVTVTGVGDVKIDGQCKAAYMIVSGAGDISCRKLIADIVTAKVSGSGDINCYASEMATATCSGAGDIDIYGEPATAKISGKKDNINIIK